jgi:hypothetical protein
MSPVQHISLSLRSLLQGIAGALPAYDPKNAGSSYHLNEQLKRLSLQLERDHLHAHVPISQVAVRLVEHLSAKGEVSAGDAVAMIEWIVAQLCSSLEVSVPRTARELETAPAEPKAPGQRLQMVSAKKLGEIMIQLSMLTPSQVERALVHQKATGCRLGEALVELQLVPREAVQTALRIQQVRRGDGGDVWGPGL